MAGYSKSMFTLKNILLYLLIGGVVYGLVYYIWFYKKGGYYGGTGYQYSSPSPEAMMAKEMKVTLSAQNNSGETGTAVLSDEKGKTKVKVTLTGTPAGVEQPAHIHVGSCPTPGAVKYPLTNVIDGTSETTLDISLDQLKNELPLAVNVHKSKQDISTYVACGDLK